jgi:hypothetical protein
MLVLGRAKIIRWRTCVMKISAIRRKADLRIEDG